MHGTARACGHSHYPLDQIDSYGSPICPDIIAVWIAGFKPLPSLREQGFFSLLFCGALQQSKPLDFLLLSVEDSSVDKFIAIKLSLDLNIFLRVVDVSNSVKEIKFDTCNKMRKVKALPSHPILCIQQLILFKTSTNSPSRRKRYSIKFWPYICTWVGRFCWRIFSLLSGYDWKPWIANVPTKDNASVLRD